MTAPPPPKSPLAVALAYRTGDAAPKVVAKGSGALAETIIERAREAGVYVHESTELVALLMQVDLDQRIPPQLYIAVAELLAWLYQLEGGAGGPPAAAVTAPTAPPAGRPPGAALPARSTAPRTCRARTVARRVDLRLDDRLKPVRSKKPQMRANSSFWSGYVDQHLHALRRSGARRALDHRHRRGPR
jgi:flagellar biosynthesis protein